MENQRWSAKNPATYLVIERSACLIFNIFSPNFA